MANTETKTSPKPPSPKKGAPTSPYTAVDLAKDTGLPSAAVARRYLRSAKITKPKDGWSWDSREAAKAALEAVQKSLKADTKKS